MLTSLYAYSITRIEAECVPDSNLHSIACELRYSADTVEMFVGTIERSAIFIGNIVEVDGRFCKMAQRCVQKVRVPAFLDSWYHPRP